MTDLDIVIVNWNRLQETRDAVRRILAWRTLVPRVWVVDNGSGDGSVAALEGEFPQIELLANPVNLGFGAANNLALRRAENQFVLLVNNDADLEEAGVERLVEILVSRPEAACAGPWIVEIGGGREVVKVGGRDIAVHAGTHLTVDRLTSAQRQADSYEVDYVSGTAVLMRRAVLAAVGLLDEEYFFGGELADFCERARRRGHPSLMVPTARAVHEVDRAGRFRSVLYPYYILRNRFLYIRKLRPSWRPILFPYWTLRGAVAIGRALVRGESDQARVLGEGLIDGWRGRSGGNNGRIRSLTGG